MRNNNIVSFDSKYLGLAQKFDCGNSALNSFLRHPNALCSSIGKTWVYLSAYEDSIIGYYNISTGSLDQVIDGRREKIGGAIHINYLAVDERYQDKVNDSEILFADILFADVLSVCEEIRSIYAGFSFITLEATSDGQKLYSRFDFEKLDDDLTFSSDSDESFSGCKMYFVLE